MSVFPGQSVGAILLPPYPDLTVAASEEKPCPMPAIIRAAPINAFEEAVLQWAYQASGIARVGAKLLVWLSASDRERLMTVQTIADGPCFAETVVGASVRAELGIALLRSPRFSGERRSAPGADKLSEHRKGSILSVSWGGAVSAVAAPNLCLDYIMIDTARDDGAGKRGQCVECRESGNTWA